MEENLQTNQKNTFAIPIAVVIAGVLIAGAVFFSNSKNTNDSNAKVPQQQVAAQQTGDLEKVKPVTSEDRRIL